MLFKLTVKDKMIPIANYPVVKPDNTLEEAAVVLRGSYCELESGICTEAGPRTILVVDEDENLVGILDFPSFLKVLIPEVAGGLTQKLQSLGISVAFAEENAIEHDESRLGFRDRVRKNAKIKVGEIMLKIRGTIQADAPLIDAVKKMFSGKITKLPVFEGEKLVGIIRDSDLFLAVADFLQSE